MPVNVIEKDRVAQLRLDIQGYSFKLCQLFWLYAALAVFNLHSEHFLLALHCLEHLGVRGHDHPIELTLLELQLLLSFLEHFNGGLVIRSTFETKRANVLEEEGKLARQAQRDVCRLDVSLDLLYCGFDAGAAEIFGPGQVASGQLLEHIHD